ncbi:MAG: hypothetical protein V1928_04020 [Parcubacteria group bacterium]
MKKPKKFDRVKFVKAVSRNAFRGMPKGRVHSSPKGKRGYRRRDGKKIPRE